jgi:hypothetical protein
MIIFAFLNLQNKEYVSESFVRFKWTVPRGQRTEVEAVAFASGLLEDIKLLQKKKGKKLVCEFKQKMGEKGIEFSFIIHGCCFVGNVAVNKSVIELSGTVPRCGLIISWTLGPLLQEWIKMSEKVISIPVIPNIPSVDGVSEVRVA